MNALGLQIVITVWFHGHALTHTIPRIYTAMEIDACFERVQVIGQRLDRHAKRNVRFAVECIPTSKVES